MVHRLYKEGDSISVYITGNLENENKSVCLLMTNGEDGKFVTEIHLEKDDLSDFIGVLLHVQSKLNKR